MAEQPTNTTQLAALIRRDMPQTGAWANLSDSEINQLAGLVAHHGTRVAACPTMWSDEGGNGNRHRRQKRRIIRARVKTDTPETGFAVAPVILMAVISWMVQRFLDWMFLDDSTKSTAVSIGSALPAWGGEDTAAIAGFPVDDEPDQEGQ
jgi:hypothetical protein